MNTANFINTQAPLTEADKLLSVTGNMEASRLRLLSKQYIDRLNGRHLITVSDIGWNLSGLPLRSDLASLARLDSTW